MTTKKGALKKVPQKKDLEDRSLQKILSLLKTRTRTDLTGYKLTTMKRRVERQMMLHKIGDIKSYEGHLKSHPEALMELHREIFIHVTEFFRDPEAFEVLKTKVFPGIVKGLGHDEAIRIWVSGCSTGEEAYSLAMTLVEFLEEKKLEAKVQIFATDISEAAINSARKGVYPKERLRAFPKKSLKRFFEETSAGLKVRKEIRDLLVFSVHDITSNPPFAKLHLISCRNVLIYFGPELQKRVFPIFHYALNPGGHLLLGQSETPGTNSKLFEVADKKCKLFTKIGGQGRLGRLPVGSFSSGRTAAARSSKNESLKNADQLLLSRYAPPGAIVSSDLEIIQFSGRTSPFLEPPKGQPTSQLLKMAHPDLVPALRVLHRAALKSKGPVRKEGVLLQLEESAKKINIEILPLNPHASERERQYVVVFEEVQKAVKKAAGTKAKSADKDPGVEDLLHEMEGHREYQQTIIEQFEASQEELTSANEELQATNEELQSTNEEMETAKEELQAANEELTTMNHELQEKNQELNDLNAMLLQSEQRFRGLVEGVRDYAIFMLDPEGRVESWNEGARRFKGYEAREIIGSHFSRFYTPEDIARKHPDKELEIARAEGKYEEEGWRVRKDGSMFWANVVITRVNDSAGNIMGFSKVTRDLTERRKAEEQLKAANQGLEQKVRERTKELEIALNSRDEFLSIASHELNTPLTSLKLQLQMARRKVDPEKGAAPRPQELARSLDLSLKQVSTLTSLVEDLLELSRIQSGWFKLTLIEFNLGELAEETVSKFSQQLQSHGMKVEFNVPPGISVCWDRHRVGQIFSNLISNAIKYAPGRPIKVEGLSRGDRVFFSVEDRGPGISGELQAKIFERFERVNADRNITGLGLGLFICKRIVEAHHGKIGVESRIGEGTKFIVELPQKLS